MNLNKVRKDRARAAKKARAEANAVAFGRTKALKQAEKAQATQDTQRHEAHKRET